MKTNNPEDLLEELNTYQHKFESLVQFAEVDSFGVVHNLRYLYWLEWARTLYFKDLGIILNENTFTQKYPLMTVHSEINYYYPCKFGEKYIVYTRVSKLGRSSLEFENIITGNRNELVASSSSVLVHVDRKSGIALDLPEDIRKMVNNFEKFI